MLDYERRVDDEIEVRWRVEDDGAFRHARGDGPLSEKRRFDAAQLERLRVAIADADLAGLAPATEPDDTAIEERWSAGGTTYVVYDDEPDAIGDLRTLVDQCVAESRVSG